MEAKDAGSILDAIKFDGHAIDAAVLADVFPHAMEYVYSGSKQVGSAVDPAKLIPLLIREVVALRQRKTPSFAELDDLRTQVTSLSNQIEALSHGLTALEKRPQPAPVQSVSATHLEVSQELVLHIKANTVLTLTSHLKDGVRVATFKLG